jgi:mannitol/fructose-specific phosphotransferase system IIA component (Ntr-type)
MDSLLDALQEGRLIELPDNSKDHVLQFLAHIIEAIPSVHSGTDVAGLVLARENSLTTGLGMGFACPHARVPYDDDLICSVGWSPQGIDYGGLDHQPVHIVIMYLVPDNQRNHYLKEVSTLAKALMAAGSSALGEMTDLDTVRNYLLDLVSTTKSETGTGTRARMIQLESRAGTAQAAESQTLANLVIETLTIISSPPHGHVVLGQNKLLVDMLDGAAGLSESVAGKGFFEINGWRIIKRGSVEYQSGRASYDCLAVKANLPQPAAQEKRT